jgi:CubicO group peptidase (beta-lactamase class C family)
MSTAHNVVRAFALMLALMLIALMVQAAPSAEARARAVIAALSTGDPAIYEKAAQEHFAAAALARRTPAQRAETVKTIHADFGALEIETIDANAASLTLVARGKGGQKLRFVFGIDSTPEAKFNSLSIEVGGPGDDEGAVKLAPPRLNANMSAPGFARALDEWFAPHVRADAFAGVVLVGRDGKAVYVRAFGLSDRERKVPANEDTAYNIASIGKKFTHVAVAKLIQDGKLKPETRLGDVIPDYPHAVSRTATVDQLLNMKGGIADFFGEGFEKADKSKLNSNHAYFEYVSKLPPNFAPGAQRAYCNGCYVVLGEMIERVADEKFESVIQRIVFAPAGMTRSGYFSSANLPANTAITYGRVRGPSAPYENTRPFHGATGSGAGGVYSTAKDLLAFDNALRANRLLSADMTAWVLQGTPAQGRNDAPMGIAGGAPGTSALLESGDGPWTVAITANVDPPLPEQMGVAIARALRQ